MSLKFTTAPTSRVHKSTGSPRKTASPLRRNANSSPRKAAHAPLQTLPDSGRPANLLRKPVSSILKAMKRALDDMFEPIPTSGLMSTKVASTYTARTALPPVVTTSHIQALMANATKCDREIAQLVKDGHIRKIVVPLRGTLGGGEEVIIRTEDLEKYINEVQAVSENGRDAFLSYTRSNKTLQTVSRSLLSPTDAAVFVRAGLLTFSSHALAKVSTAAENSTAFADAASMASLIATSIAAPAGTVAAVGGEGSVSAFGGNFLGRALSRRENEVDPDMPKEDEFFRLSLPGMGGYLRLLLDSRAHLVTLLGRSIGSEAPLSLLGERWDGGITVHQRRDATAPSIGRTQKWKSFNGLRSEWVIAECVGSGILELFDTGSVGVGVRSTGKRA
jgi:hypothetical protein